MPRAARAAPARTRTRAAFVFGVGAFLVDAFRVFVVERLRTRGVDIVRALFFDLELVRVFAMPPLRDIGDPTILPAGV
jgi:hypothetical protein